jgi:hypothetical protein
MRENMVYAVSIEWQCYLGDIKILYIEAAIVIVDRTIKQYVAYKTCIQDGVCCIAQVDYSLGNFLTLGSEKIKFLAA